MSPKDTFFEYINSGYAIKGDFINLGAAMLGEETISDAFVKLPLKTLNRHGLIASATGIGKTKKNIASFGRKLIRKRNLGIVNGR